MDPDFWPWLAGTLDSDGCFTVALVRVGGKKSKRNPDRPVKTYLRIAPMIRVGWSEKDERWTHYIKEQAGVGKTYISNKGSEWSDGKHEIASWQTTNLRDSLQIADKVTPYLRVKRGIAVEFQDIIRLWMKHKGLDKYGNPMKGTVVPRPIFSDVISRAIKLNERRQTERWRGVRNQEYYEKILDTVYGNQEKDARI